MVSLLALLIFRQTFFWSIMCFIYKEFMIDRTEEVRTFCPSVHITWKILSFDSFIDIFVILFCNHDSYFS